jgi:hypothetical protein
MSDNVALLICASKNRCKITAIFLSVQYLFVGILLFVCFFDILLICVLSISMLNTIKKGGIVVYIKKK